MAGLDVLERIDGNTARTAELAESIERNTARTVELGDATLVILGEILSVLRTISEGLSDLRDLTESHSAALLQILDRLGPPNPGGATA